MAGVFSSYGGNSYCIVKVDKKINSLCALVEKIPALFIAIIGDVVHGLCR